MKGINIASTVANAVITISFPRGNIVTPLVAPATHDQFFFTYLQAFQYSNAYDPTTGCCPTQCPPQTGLDVQIDPPVCVYCNTAADLVYNANSGTCSCKPGFYLDSTKTFVCFPC